MAERVDPDGAALGAGAGAAAGAGSGAGAGAALAADPGAVGGAGASGAIGAAAAPPHGAATSAGAGTPPDIRDIRGILPIPYPRLLPLAIALGGLTALLLGWLGVRWWRRRRARPAPQPSAEELAYARLAAAERLLAEGRSREFGAAVSEAVRLYIEDRLARRAARQTTEELLRELVREPGSPLAPHRELLADFLQHCDLAKFARHPLQVDEMRAMHASAVRFVEAVRASAGTPSPSEGAAMRATGEAAGGARLAG
jgi:hypothetical protein